MREEDTVSHVLYTEPRRGVKCDVCGKPCGKKFRAVLIYITTYQEKYRDGEMEDAEKDFDVCNSCADNLNFRELSKRRVKKK